MGASSDFDKLTLEVWTDGTISARDAVSLGAKILCDHFTLFTDLSENVGSKPLWWRRRRPSGTRCWS